MAVVMAAVRVYAEAIILYGNKSFDALKPDYVQSVKDNIVERFSRDQVIQAWYWNFITEAEKIELLDRMPIPIVEEPVALKPEPPAEAVSEEETSDTKGE